jgi:very-short-patch-repair endonuclease
MGVIRDRRERLAQHRARRLRRRDTDAEARLWAVLGGREGLGGWRWRRQVPFGPYILDFLCREAGLVVELDGGQHGERTEYDARRTAWLARAGLRVVRFWNSAVLTNRAGLCDSILAACGGERGPGPG